MQAFSSGYLDKEGKELVEIYSIAKVTDPADGHMLNLYITEAEAQYLFQHAINELVARGAISFAKQKGGVDVESLALDKKETVN